jgi:spore coat protein CotH
MLLIGFYGCHKENNPPVNTDEIKQDIEYVTYQETVYDSLFDINNHIRFDIIIDDSELSLLQSDYEYYTSIASKSPIYRKCHLTVAINETIYQFEEVGIRMKGNTSRTDFYDESIGLYNLIHFKLSFGETFDDETYYETPKVWESDEARDARKDRTFGGMEKIDLKWNKNFDQTHLREHWANDMFSAYGILSSKLNLSQVRMTVHGVAENLGVYNIIEDVDESFLEKRLAEKHLGGDLYKVGWDNEAGGELTLRTLSKIGKEDEDKSYFPVYDLKTNKKTSDNGRLINLINAVNDVNSDLDEVVDMHYYLTYQAACYLIGNPDDTRNHYNNYYIYFLADTRKAIFIPYDFDRCFGITKDWNPTGDGMISYNPYTKMTTMGGCDDQVNPLILRTVVKKADAIYLAKYHDLILSMVSSKFYDITNSPKNMRL